MMEYPARVDPQTFRQSLSRLHITDAKSKLPIVRKRRATHAIVMAVVNWKQLRRSLVQVLVQDGGRLFADVFSVRWRPAKAKSKGYIALRRLSRAVLPLYIRTWGITLQGGRGGCGGGAKKGNNASMHWRAVCAVCYTLFFTPLHTHTCAYVHTCTQPCVRTASDLPSLHRGVSLLCARGTRRILHHCRDSKRMFGIFAFWHDGEGSKDSRNIGITRESFYLRMCQISERFHLMC